MSAPDDHAAPAPRSPIRRFDVFAEYTRQERLAKGDPADEAKGYGIWLAKVVAARRFGAKAGTAERGAPAGRHETRHEHQKFRSVGDELQTDETFDDEIIDRMGAPFYHEVFAPAIAEAIAQGESYERIRDTIRKEWKPPRAR